MKIEEYVQANHQSCVEIFNSNTPAYFGTDELQGLETWLTGQDNIHLAYKNTIAEHFYVIEHNDLFIGCGGFYIIRDTPIANMVWGMVHNVFHKQGFGKKLFEYRVEQIRTKYSGHRIILDTTQHTYKFFEKHGFETTQIRQDFYALGLDRYDMSLSL